MVVLIVVLSGVSSIEYYCGLSFFSDRLASTLACWVVVGPHAWLPGCTRNPTSLRSPSQISISSDLRVCAVSTSWLSSVICCLSSKIRPVLGFFFFTAPVTATAPLQSALEGPFAPGCHCPIFSTSSSLCRDDCLTWHDRRLTA